MKNRFEAGSISDLKGDKRFNKIFFSFASFLLPDTIYEIDLENKDYYPQVPVYYIIKENFNC